MDATDDEFNYIDSFFKRVLDEDKHLCNSAQRNLNAGVFVNGELHPMLESAPIFFQNVVRRLVMGHRNDEKVKGEDIWPASCPLSGLTPTEEEDAEFCSTLECDASASGAREW